MRFYEVSKIREIWTEISFQRCVFPAGDAYAKALAAEFTNGSVHYCMFRASNYGSLPDLFTYDNWKYSLVHKLIWDHPDIVEHLPKLETSGISDDTFTHTEFFSHVSFLASALNSGGAYSEKRSTVAQKRSHLDLAFAAVAALLPDPEPFPLVLESQDPWCDYFYDIAWDLSAITWSATTRCFGLFIATDTD